MPKRSKSCSRAACPPRSSTRWPSKLEAFIARHGHARVLEIVKDFEGMDAIAFWHDIKFSLRHVKDFSRRGDRLQSRHASSLVEPGRALHELRGGALFAGRGRGRPRLADVAGRRRRLALVGLLDRRRRLVLDRLQILDDRLDVVRAEHEDRHVRDGPRRCPRRAIRRGPRPGSCWRACGTAAPAGAGSSLPCRWRGSASSSP